MPHEHLDRFAIRFKSLSERDDRIFIERDHVSPVAPPPALSDNTRAIVDETVERLVQAKKNGRACMLVFGAHAIKNGLSPVMTRLIEQGWITHLATNGAGIIHDWEFAFQGHSSEHVAANVAKGEFGAWQETGFYLNLALVVGAYEGLGYGESIGALVEHEGLTIPNPEALIQEVSVAIENNPSFAGGAADLLAQMNAFDLSSGPMSIAHPFKKYGLQAAAYRLGVPFTGHPMIGHDIIYLHPMNHCAAVGRTAERDFLTYAMAVSELDGGVYISVGSAVMSPMIFEKSLSMAQNIAAQRGETIRDHFMVIVDLMKSHWDWRQGEPPSDNPDYYLRYNKSFSRMGGTMRYTCSDNRDFLLALLHALEAKG